MAADEGRSGRRWSASIGFGALACLGCCVVVPVLAAAGVAGSGLLLGTGWVEPLGFVLIAVGVVGGGVSADLPNVELTAAPITDPVLTRTIVPATPVRPAPSDAVRSVAGVVRHRLSRPWPPAERPAGVTGNACPRQRLNHRHRGPVSPAGSPLRCRWPRAGTPRSTRAGRPRMGEGGHAVSGARAVRRWRTG